MIARLPRHVPSAEIPLLYAELRALGVSPSDVLFAEYRAPHEPAFDAQVRIAPGDEAMFFGVQPGMYYSVALPAQVFAAEQGRARFHGSWLVASHTEIAPLADWRKRAPALGEMPKLPPLAAPLRSLLWDR